MTVTTWLATAVALGAVHAALGLAVVAVTTVTRTLHLAIGPVVVAAASVQVAVVVLGGSPLTALAVGTLVAGAVSVGVVGLVARRTIDPTVRLVGLLVAGGVVELGVARVFGGATRRLPPLVGSDPVAAAALVGVPVALVLAGVLHRSRWGRRLRLVGGSPEAAERVGVSPTTVVLGTAAVAGAVAAVAAALIAPVSFVGVASGSGLTVRGVAAAVLLGRLGAVQALAGGLAIGVLEASALSLLAGPWVEVALLASVVVVLAARPPDRRRAWGRAW